MLRRMLTAGKTALSPFRALKRKLQEKTGG